MTTPKPTPECQALAIASLLLGMNPDDAVITAEAGGAAVIVVRPGGPLDAVLAAVSAALVVDNEAQRVVN